MSFNYFPYNQDDAKPMKNPAIQLFGNRLFLDQTNNELLVEFLLVVFSTKRIGSDIDFNSALPSKSVLDNWRGDKLEYAPKARLNLKLFSFLGASRLDSRHHTHRTHHETLLNQFRERINVAGAGEKDDVIRTIENLFLGFQGAGRGRTWCAQSFLPVSKSFLAGESIWKQSKAKKSEIEDWFELLETRSSYFDMNQHLFFARGGELIYLQICNALRKTRVDIETWCQKNELGFTPKERDPEWLHAQLESSLISLMNHCPGTLTDIANFIDHSLDPETPDQTDGDGMNPRFTSAEWCNADSWQEGYMFAVELLRLLQTNLDVLERIYLLETACAMQVLRTLAMQSSRIMDGETAITWPGYRFAISSPEDKRAVVRRLSQQSVKAVEKSIFKALRSEYVELPEDQIVLKKTLKQADKAYGSKLFLGLSKRLGFVVPKRGSGARFILTEQLLRLLVVTTVPLGGRLTFDKFKFLLERRHGMVFDSPGLDIASKWLSGKGIYLPADTDIWLQEMLEAAGFLVHLSDSCALIENPADIRKDV